MKKIIIAGALSLSLLLPSFSSVSAMTIHTVESGDTLSGISKEYGISLSELRKVNNKYDDLIYIGQELVIPINIHTVQSGDSLWSISKNYNVSIDSIRELNNKYTDILSIGEELLIPTTEVVEKEVILDSTVNYHTVVSGDTLWKIANTYSTTIESIRKVNNKYDDMLYVGDNIEIPYLLTEEDKDLLARLVHAESKGEIYEGKVAVAHVVLNRVDSSDFPNNLKDVVYETYGNGSVYAFSPVQNGTINQSAGLDSIKAVEEAIKNRGKGGEAIFFYNPEISTSEWIFTREVIEVIGNHNFAK